MSLLFLVLRVKRGEIGVKESSVLRSPDGGFSGHAGRSGCQAIALLTLWSLSLRQKMDALFYTPQKNLSFATFSVGRFSFSLELDIRSTVNCKNQERHQIAPKFGQKAPHSAHLKMATCRPGGTVDPGSSSAADNLSRDIFLPVLPQHTRAGALLPTARQSLPRHEGNGHRPHR